MSPFLLLGFVVSLSGGLGSPPVSDTAGYELVWSDEFEKPGLPDTGKWVYDTGGHGWGNNELQYYSRERTQNVRSENGILVIEARKDNYKGNQYSSARILTRGKAEWLYGRIEVRARLPKGRGTWPAIWMLPTMEAYGGWPASGEIDIMEHVGFDPGTVHGTVHTAAYNHTIGTQKGGRRTIADAMENFHVYSIEWTADKIDFMIDDSLYFSFANEHKDSQSWPFDKPFHLILNIAVGGNWGGQKGVDEKIWPQKMLVDYVRVYQKK